MLIVLYGITAKMGHISRQYFTSQGFETIEKLNYIPQDSVLQTYHGERKRAAKEEVLACTYRYESEGMLIGFREEQITDAVRGRKKCLLTLSSSDVKFLRYIKELHGDYVTVIGAYIDDRSLEMLTRELSGISEREVAARLGIGQIIKENLIRERSLFDEIVIYGGEDSLFNGDALCNQYAHMIEKAERREKLLNDRTYVELPYSGNKDYIFASYAHADWERVSPVLSMLQRSSCRIWYDRGILVGEEWRAMIAAKIQGCKQFFLFSSENAVRSDHIKAEINAALKCEKKIITIRLDKAEFELRHEMYLANYQNLFLGEPDFDSKTQGAADASVKE